jgi:hypothetical protein
LGTDEQSDEPSDFIEGGEFLHVLRECLLIELNQLIGFGTAKYYLRNYSAFLAIPRLIQFRIHQTLFTI